jgi:hypothetical protein
MIEEVAGHESVVALRMSLGKTYIFVHVEGDDVLERNLTGTVGLDESIIHADGRRTRGKAEYEFVVGGGVETVDTFDDVVSSPL